mmetsp:Transcript_62438/g.99265  ORF Transcript_62438/g.99265 Transcript_62438/m.99265 type:complete len:321 (-) Transcript_62438:373-1335(-)
MKVETIENNYRLWIGLAYFCAFLCQIPLLIEHMPREIGVETAFNTYSPAVIMILLGCFLFIIDRMIPHCGDKFRLQLFSAILLSIGSTVWCICGVSWSSRLCSALFDSALQRDQCWGATFLNFFALSCMILYLCMSVIDDLFKAKARLMLILLVQFMAFIHLILYLVVNSVAPSSMSTHLKFYYYFLIIFIATTISISILTICTPNSQYFNNSSILSFSLVFVTIFSLLLSLFLIVYGSLNYWLSQKINNGDGAAFIGYTICYCSANIWIIIETYLYKQERMECDSMSSSSSRPQYRYDAIRPIDDSLEHDQREPLNVVI